MAAITRINDFSTKTSSDDILGTEIDQDYDNIIDALDGTSTYDFQFNGTTQLENSSGTKVFDQDANGIISLALQPAAKAYASGTTAISSGVATKITLDTEAFDINADFDSTTNYEFVAPVAGIYAVVGQIKWSDALADAKFSRVMIYQNATAVATNTILMAASDNISRQVMAIIKCAATDTIQLWVTHDDTGSKNVASGENVTYMTVYKLP